MVFLAATVIGGMAAGVFTATESAAVGAVLAFGFAVWRRALTRKTLRQALIGTAGTSGMIYVLIIGASLFGYFAAVTQAPQALVEAVQASGIPVWAAVLALMAMFIVAGAVFDATGSYTPVIWGCLLLSALATAAAWRLVGPPPPAPPAAAA